MGLSEAGMQKDGQKDGAIVANCRGNRVKYYYMSPKQHFVT
jgi:hypothetical protein